MENITCYLCGIVFGCPDNWVDNRRDRHDTFYCPNGHDQHFVGKSEAERLKDEVEARKKQLLNAEERLKEVWKRVYHQERRARAYRGKFYSIKERLNGRA